MQHEPKTQVLQGETAQTLDRGIRLLEVLAHYPGGLTIQELAQQLELHRTITYRLLNTLAAHRLVSRINDGRYCLGTGLVELARHVTPRLQEVALPELSRLAEELGATACLTILDGNEAVVLNTIAPKTSPMHLAYRSGYRHALDLGASGIAILAGRTPLPTERAEITLARQRGYAVSYGEIQQGASGIAAPILLKGQPCEASIGIIVLGRIDEATCTTPVIAAAKAIAAAMVA